VTTDRAAPIALVEQANPTKEQSMNHRPIRILAASLALTGPLLLGACGDSDPAPSDSDEVTTTTEAMSEEGGSTTGGSMMEGEEETDGSMMEGEEKSDGSMMEEESDGSMTDDTTAEG
jgi:hypothetical protein